MNSSRRHVVSAGIVAVQGCRDRGVNSLPHIFYSNWGGGADYTSHHINIEVRHYWVMTAKPLELR